MLLLRTCVAGLALMLAGVALRAQGAAPSHDSAAVRLPKVQPAASADSATLYGTYRETSPHWPHIRTMVTDFRTQYVKPPQQARERAWTAAHFDYVMSGDGGAYKALNPSVKTLPYALLWTVYAPGQKEQAKLSSGSYSDMAAWFDAHPSDTLEHAFLHKAGGTKTPNDRLVFQIWDKQLRYALNPGDSGVRAYEADRMVRIAQGSDGVFLDEFGAGGIHGHLKPGTLEYPELKGYDEDLTALLADIKHALGSRILMINTAEYRNPPDEAMILAAGAAHLERMNNPISGDVEGRMKFFSDLLDHDVLTELVSLDSWSEVNSRKGVFASYTPGDYSSSAERLKMFELATYYMVVPKKPDLLLLDLQNAWTVPFSQVWLKAQEVNIGHPHAPRTLMATGVDATGHKYHVWSRDFDRALIVMRPVIGWDQQRFDDSTIVRVPLPRGQVLRPLRGDGTLGDPVTELALRNSEAVILLKEPATP